MGKIKDKRSKSERLVILLLLALAVTAILLYFSADLQGLKSGKKASESSTREKRYHDDYEEYEDDHEYYSAW